MLLLPDGGRCSQTVTGPHTAYTAWHCAQYLPGAVQLGADLAQVHGDYPPPYARLAGAVGEELLLEGFGCDPVKVWAWVLPRRSVRPARVLVVGFSTPGIELLLDGRICPGDSGGAVWNDHGNLVAIMTATSTRYPNELGFATPVGGLRSPSDSDGPPTM